MGKFWFRRLFGDLERDIMVIMWKKESATVRDIYEELRISKSIAYTTVMTIMNRLCEKGLLKKDCNETAFVYSYAITKNEFIHLLLCEIIDGLENGELDETVSYLVKRLQRAKPSDKLSV